MKTTFKELPWKSSGEYCALPMPGVLGLGSWIPYAAAKTQHSQINKIFLKTTFMQLLLLLLSRFSRVRLFATPWTAAYQGPPSMGFSRQEYWSGLPLPTPVYVVTHHSVTEIQLFFISLGSLLVKFSLSLKLIIQCFIAHKALTSSQSICLCQVYTNMYFCIVLTDVLLFHFHTYFTSLLYLHIYF